ncbi:helix-turn-helix transcriptional regulator [Hazenella sp. IB182357]|uniref:Helix-turn-helix transcriptional regulator n=1 Tax=Polycladospora coralii TaxID=2771432 RepID=A0A926NI35_9BACL|nr:helix-turn-helix transcriptional regulator [Polycladospora coralii]
MITYEPFRLWYVKHFPNHSRNDIAKETGLSRHTITKIWNDNHTKTETLERICETYKLRIEQVCEYREQK